MTDFALLYDPLQACWLRFCNPVEVYTVHTLDQVIPTLQRLEQRVETERLFAAGFISYEAAPAFDAALQTHAKDDFPLLSFGLFPAPEMVERPATTVETSPLNWRPALDENRFATAVARIHDEIARGATYQVNFTFPLTAEFNGDPQEFFEQLALGQQAPGAGYLETPDWAICSASPELFFHRDGEHLTMRPMKGTAPRGRTLAEDRDRAETLRHSTKDQAENVMILDMVRNDLGRIAPPGSVQVEALYSLEKYPTVWQLTSSATARTAASLTEIFQALFPCASITGAPKAQTMQIIAGLETGPRRLYTGTFGWFGPGRQARFNVAIRTALVDKLHQKIVYGVGAGITWDSKSPEEYRECLAKAAILSQRQPEFALLETLRWSPYGGYFVLAQHLDRLQDSADYFEYPFDERGIRHHLDSMIENFEGTRAQRVRLLLHSDGRLESSHTVIDERQGQNPLRVKLAQNPVNSTDRFLYHKTTHRRIYEIALAEDPDVDDVLLWNQRGEVTEFCIGNLVAELDGKWLTPPVSSGLLPGTYRQYLLDHRVITEQVLTLDDLRCCRRLFLVNAVRKWQPVLFME